MGQIKQKQVNGLVSALAVVASDTTQGKVELATIAETTTGTDATRAVTPDGLAGSIFGYKTVTIQVTDPAGDALTIGDGKAYYIIGPDKNGMNLVGVQAGVITVSSSGLPTFQIRNVTDSVDMLTTKVSIDASEYTSATAVAPPVINTSTDDVATGDRLAIDCDVAGTGAKGVFITLIFQLP